MSNKILPNSIFNVFYLQLFKFFFFMMACFTLIKIVSFFIFYPLFSTLSFIDIAKALYVSFRLDSIVLGFISTIPTIAILILANFKNKISLFLMRFFIYLWIGLFLVCVFMMIGDLVYFSQTQSHVFQEVFVIKNQIDFFATLAFSDYLFVLILAFISLSIIAYISNKILNANLLTYSQNTTITKKILGGVLCILFIFANARGWHYQNHPLGVANVYEYGKVVGKLAVNDMFLIAQAMQDNSKKRERKFDAKKARDIYLQAYGSKNVIFKQDNPLYKKYKQPYLPPLPNNKHYNVVLILVESLEYFAIDSVAGLDLRVSKNLDYLVKNGVYFDNFYANGKRSLDALTNIITSLSTPQDAPRLGFGIVSIHNTPTIAQFFKNNNYTTSLIQSSQRDCLMLDSSAKVSGFDYYYGASNFPLLGDEQNHTKHIYLGWDGNMLKFNIGLIDKLYNSSKDGFFAMAFSATMHYPYTSPGKKYQLYPHSDFNIYGYLNNLNYFDQKLGEFIKTAKTKPWFESTIFIITADHKIDWDKNEKLMSIYKIKRAKEYNKLSKLDKHYKIPLIIYAPKLLKPQTKHIVATQTDIAPTISHLLGLKTYISSNGNSLFDDDVHRYNTIYETSGAWFFDKNGIIYHNYKTYKPFAGDNSLQLNRVFLSTDKIISDFIFNANKQVEDAK